MKIVILTVDQVYSNLIIKNLINELGSEIVYIAESANTKFGKRVFKFLKRYVGSAGLKYCWIQAVKLEMYRMISAVYSAALSGHNYGKFYSYKRMAMRNKIKIDKVPNANSSEFIGILKKIRPDLVVSVYFDQLLKEKLINIPKKGVINIHPAYLPDYKGVSPVFWAIANREKTAGISVHYIDNGIDTGRIIARKRIAVDRSDDEDSLYWKLTKLGAPMLVSVIKEIKTGEPRTISNKGGRYFSLPTRKAVKTYLSRGRKFYRLRKYLFLN